MKSWPTVDSLCHAVHRILEQMQRQQPLEWQIEQQCLIATRALRIHQSLRLEQVLATTVAEVKALLQVDRVLIYQYRPGGSGGFVAESVEAPWPSALEVPMPSGGLQPIDPRVRPWGEAPIAPSDGASLGLAGQDWLTLLRVKTSLVVPILRVDSEGLERTGQMTVVDERDGVGLDGQSHSLLWGLLVIHQCDRPRQWQPTELELLQQLLPQVAIAIHRASVYTQLHRHLEGRKSSEQLHQVMAERRLAETLLKVSQSRFQKLAANIPGIIYQYLLRPDGTDAIPYVSDGLRDLCGLEPGAVMQDSHHACQCIHVEDRARLSATLAESGRSLQPWHQEFRIVTPSGQVKWVEANARPEPQPDGGVLWDGLLIDVSDRNAAEEALRISEARLQAILDNSKTVVSLKDLDGRHLLVNRAGEQLFQKSAWDVLGKTVQDILSPDVADIIQQHDQQVLTTCSSLEFEEQIPQSDGLHTYLSVKFPLVDEQGQIYAIGSIGTDITERKRVELEVQNALEQEKELNQLKSRFISMASHEFRTPLTVIASSADILQRYATQLGSDQSQRHFERIQSSVTHITRLLDNVLMINKADAEALEFQPTPIDLVNFSQLMVEEIQFGYRDHRLTLHLGGSLAQSPSLPQLWGQFDPRLLRQIFTNLLTNAIQYSPAASRVEVVLAGQGDRAVIQVRDQGMGIPLADQPRLFDAFHRGSNVGAIPGTGLGLAITKQCVELHGGTVTVTSQINQGTLVVVDMPLNSAPT